MFHNNIGVDKVTRQCPQTTTFEEKGEPKRIRNEVFQLTSLTPYRWATPAQTREGDDDDDDDDELMLNVLRCHLTY